MALTQLADSGQPFPNGATDVQRTTFALDVLGRFNGSTAARSGCHRTRRGGYESTSEVL